MILPTYTIATFIGLGSLAPNAWYTEVDQHNKCRRDVLTAFYEYFDLIETYQTDPAVDSGSLEPISKRLFSIIEEIVEGTSQCEEVDGGALLRKVVKPYTHITGDAKVLRLYEKHIDAQLDSSQSSEVQKDIDLYYRLTWQLRDYERFNNWPDDYVVSDLTLKEWPQIEQFINVDHSNFSMTNLSFDNFEVLVVADLFCGFSQKMFSALESGESEFDSDIELTFAFGQFSNSAPKNIIDLSKRLPAHQFVLVLNDQYATDEIYFYQFPVFYFLHNGQVVDKLLGWPNAQQSEVVNDKWRALRRLASDKAQP